VISGDCWSEKKNTGFLFSLGMAEMAICFHPVRLDLSAESATIQQCFSLTTNQRTVLSAQ
jgi:hypothetical protein